MGPIQKYTGDEKSRRGNGQVNQSIEWKRSARWLWIFSQRISVEQHTASALASAVAAQQYSPSIVRGRCGFDQRNSFREVYRAAGEDSRHESYLTDTLECLLVIELATRFSLIVHAKKN